MATAGSKAALTLRDRPPVVRGITLALDATAEPVAPVLVIAPLHPDMDVRVVQGDIAEKSADALVNAAGTSLRMGSGVAGALRRAAGGPINEAAIEQGPVELGGVAVTDAFELDAECVIHAAAMPHYGDGQATAESIREATHNALETADDLDCRSVVLPMLGCGVAGFDLEAGARIICETVAAYEPDAVTEVRLIGYSESEYETVRAVAEETL